MKRYVVFLAALFFAPLAFAQDPATGFPPFGSFQNGGFDGINRQNLNVNFAIPLTANPARGGNFSFAIVYDSLIWKRVTTGSTTSWTPVTKADGSPSWGWKLDSPIGTIPYSTRTKTCKDYSDYPPATVTFTYYTGYSFVDTKGTSHAFNVTVSPGLCGVPDVETGYATDNSGYYLDATTPTAPVVYDKSGVKVTNFGTKPNTNGNLESRTVVNSTETDWTDTANHVALKIFKYADHIDYQYPDTTGSYRTITLNLGTFQVKTNFGCSGVVEYTGTASLPTSISYPNGQSYSFTYEQTPNTPGYYTARAQRVILPTGGYYEYDYPQTGNNGINCSDATVTSITRVINDGASSATWQFTRAFNTAWGASQWATITTAPKMPYDSVGNDSVFVFDTWPREVGEFFYQGSSSSGQLLRTIYTYWMNGTPTNKTTILEDGQTQSGVDMSYDSNGNLLLWTEHDWGSATSQPVIRQTYYTYLTDTSYTSRNILDRVTRITIYDSTGLKSRTDIAYDEAGYVNSTCITGALQHDDTNYGCTFTTRGNPTTITVYTDPVTPGGGISKHTYYDSLGNAVRADVNCCQQEQWVYSATTNYAFPDRVVRGPSGNQLTTSTTYSAYTGLVASTTDENNQTTTFSYDFMNRLTTITRPDNAQITYSYTDATPPAQSAVTVSAPIQGTSVRKQTSSFNGLGILVKTTILDGSLTSYSIAETQYDPLGRPYRVSNPHNSTAQYWTETRFDGLARTAMLIPPDGSPSSNNTSYAYATNTVTVTDPAGKRRKSQIDGSGRLVSVWEPDVNNGNALTQLTSYTYSVFDTLATVAQGVQTRTYSYDALSRLTSVKTPETNNQAVSYQYDPVFYTLVTQRTDARGVLTSYNYDALNRLQQISYNVGTTGVPATPTVTFTYGTSAAQNNNGRLMAMTDGVGSGAYTYDILGRTTQLQKVISGTTYTTIYAYNSASELISIQYPSGRTVQPSYDAIGRLSTIADTMGSTNTTYASNFGYNPAFEVTGLNYGNGVAASFGYSNERLRLTSLSYVKNTQTLFGLNYWYKQDQSNCAGGTTGNNGQIQCITDTGDGTRSLKYTYDALYRLTVAQAGPDASPTWKLSFTYDRYGNRTDQSLLAGSIQAPTNHVSIDPTTNRIIGSPYSHDLNGNMTNDGLNTLTYDAENRVVSSASGGTTSTYTYDGNALRVQKQVGSASATVYIFSGTKVIAEYPAGANPNSPSNEYIYSGSSLLATISGATTTYHHADHLSVRVTTDTGGSVLPNGQQGHYPFGEQWYPTVTQSPATKWQFTSYERDNGTGESGNDYAMARYHINRLGRFSAPDLLAGSSGSPQSLNRYAYVANDPVNLVDPLGLRMTNYDGFGGISWVANYDPWMLISTWGNGPENHDSRACWQLGFMCILSYTAVWNDFGGGGDPGGGGPQCTLNIAVNNKAGLSDTALTAAENQIAALVAPAIDVNFTASGNSDYTLKLADAKPGNSDLGSYRGWWIFHGTPTVYINNVQNNFSGQSAGVVNNVIGAVGAHELVHRITGIGDLPFDPNNPNDLMGTNKNPNAYDLFVKNGFQLKSSDLQKLRQACLKKHPN